MKTLKNVALCFSLSALGLSGCGSSNDGQSSSNGASGTRGVTADAIHLGTHQDLSGPTASWGVAFNNAIRMHFDEINAAGGIHGRQIKYFVEDTQYQVPAAVKAANKLLNVHNVFAMVGNMGTPMNNAVLPKQLAMGVPNAFPVTGARQMHHPLHPLKFAIARDYYDQVRLALAHFGTDKTSGKKPVACLQSVASDYGAEIDAGFEQGVIENGLEVAYTGHHKTTESDFTGTVTGIKNAGCDLLVMGTIVKDSILLYSAARDAGWNGTAVAVFPAYTSEVASAADGKMEGLFVVSSFKLADFKKEVEANSWVGQWYTRYVGRFGTDPNIQAEFGYLAGSLVTIALERAGTDLTTDSFVKALESIEHFEDPFGGSPISLSATKHFGGSFLNLYQVQDRQWELIEERLGEE